MIGDGDIDGILGQIFEGGVGIRCIPPNLEGLFFLDFNAAGGSNGERGS
jgi:hypothetical protein